MACILGTSKKGCEKISVGASNSRPVSEWPLSAFVTVRSVKFAGRNDVGDEIWDVVLGHSERTYVMSPPDQDGRVQRLLTREGPPDRQCDNLVEQLLPKESHARVSCHILEQNIAQPATVASAATGAPSVTAAKAEIVASTPTGTGDPNATVCRAPQHLADSDQLGPQVCLHNYEWWKVAMNGKDIGPDGKTLIDRPTVDNPKGEGDPDAVTCRTRKVVSRQTDWVKSYSPVVCRQNSFWADLIKNHQMVDLNGKVVARSNPFGGQGGLGPAFVSGVGSGNQDSGYASQSSANQGFVNSNNPSPPSGTP